jgi:hypothetical protein
VAWRERAVLAGMLRGPRLLLGRVGIVWLSLLAAVVLVNVAESWARTVQYPHGDWDAWNHWNVVSRFIYRGGEDWLGTFERTGDHPDYPLLLSVSNAISWGLMARETTRAPIALSFFFLLCLAALLFGLLNRLRDARQGVLGTIVLLSHMGVSMWAMAQIADVPLALYILASAGLMLVRSAGGAGTVAVLGGFAAGLAAWTKNEGLAFALVSTLTWTIAARHDGTTVRNYLFGLSFPLLVVALFKVFLAPPNDVVGAGQDVLSMIQDFSRYVDLVRAGVDGLRVVRGNPLPILMGMLVYAILMGKSRLAASGLVPAALIVLGQLAIYAAILIISPHGTEWHVRSSVNRLYIHVEPLIVLCLFSWLKSPGEMQAQDRSPVARSQ